MRKKRITIGMLSMMMAVSSVFGGVNVSAATPKLTANQVFHEPTGKPVGLIFKINLIGTTCKTDRISLALSE